MTFNYLKSHAMILSNSAFGTACLAVLLFTTSAVAQDKPLAEQMQEASESVNDAAAEVGETIEAVTEQVAEASEEFAERLGEWMDEHGKELGAWTDQHGDDWGQWAEQFEKRAQTWAKGQERQWESWAQKYTKEMEGMAEQLEDGDMSSDQIESLVKKNLRMLSAIPIGDMIQSGLKEGLGELEDAPWQSLDELKAVAGNAIADSVEEVEGLVGQQIADMSGTDQALRRMLSQLPQKQKAEAIEIEQQFARRIEAFDDMLTAEGEEGEVARAMVEKLKNLRDQKLANLKPVAQIQAEQSDSQQQGEMNAEQMKALMQQVELLTEEVNRLKNSK